MSVPELWEGLDLSGAAGWPASDLIAAPGEGRWLLPARLPGLNPHPHLSN